MRGRRVRRFIPALAVMMVGALGAGCDDDPAGPRIPLEELQGEYQTTTLTFDPQGSAPAADVLAALVAAGRVPSLNIDLVNSFQVLYRDPVTGSLRTLGGSTRGTDDGIRLTFSSQQMADEFLFPRTIPLVWDPTAETLTFSGEVTIDRERLLELFPELYANEQFLDPTPGTMTVVFTRGGVAAT